jgi:hypothetical protein
MRPPTPIARAAGCEAAGCLPMRFVVQQTRIVCSRRGASAGFETYAIAQLYCRIRPQSLSVSAKIVWPYQLLSFIFYFSLH